MEDILIPLKVRARRRQLVGGRLRFGMALCWRLAATAEHGGQCEQGQRPQQRDHEAKNAKVRVSMLSRAGASAGLVGSLNAVCAVKRARPSAALS